MRRSLSGRRSFRVRLVVGSGGEDGRSGRAEVALVGDVVLDGARVGSRGRIENRFQGLPDDDGRRGQMIRRGGEVESGARRAGEESRRGEEGERASSGVGDGRRGNGVSGRRNSRGG